MAFDRFHRKKDEMGVDLIPVMNLFVVLIPFLLLSAAFFHVGVIPTSLPSQSDSASDIATSPHAVTVNLEVELDAIHISASNPSLDEEALAALSMTVPRTGEGYDLEVLTTALAQIKGAYAESDTVIVLPGEGIYYRDVVSVLDAARERVTDPGTPEEKRVPLFPVVVLSKKV